MQNTLKYINGYKVNNYINKTAKLFLTTNSNMGHHYSFAIDLHNSLMACMRIYA